MPFFKLWTEPSNMKIKPNHSVHRLLRFYLNQLAAVSVPFSYSLHNISPTANPHKQCQKRETPLFGTPNHHLHSSFLITNNSIPLRNSSLPSMSLFSFQKLRLQTPINIPHISIIRSAIIIFFYSLWDWLSLSRGLYLGITTLCSVVSLVYVSLKASYMFGFHWVWKGSVHSSSRIRSVCMLAGYGGRSCCCHIQNQLQKTRKLLVYKINIDTKVK